MAQVEKEHYDTTEYDTKQRYYSYVEQIWETMQTEPKDIVEVGVGNGFVSRALRTFPINLTTVDFDASLTPNIVASVTAIPLEDSTADICVCFEVLEHLPFDQFVPALNELARISRKWIFISVPDIRSTMSLEISRGWSKVRSRQWCLNGIGFRKPLPHHFNGEHYWEIGKLETPESLVLAEIGKAKVRLIRHYRLPLNPFHHFFLMEKVL